MELTKERIYIECPEFYGEDTIKRHIERYKWANQYVNIGNVVLDAGCGSGYGTSILSIKASKVLGIDQSKSAIEYAIENYGLKNTIEFQLLDLDFIDINLKDIKFDIIVCIEVIEHLGYKRAKKLLQVFSSLLNQDGRLLITTPDKTQSKNDNPYHLCEFSVPEIYDLISGYFKIIEQKLENGFIYIMAKNE